jgi:hypothetical protein
MKTVDLRREFFDLKLFSKLDPWLENNSMMSRHSKKLIGDKR